MKLLKRLMIALLFFPLLFFAVIVMAIAAVIWIFTGKTMLMDWIDRIMNEALLYLLEQ